MVFPETESNAFRFLKHDYTLTIDSDDVQFLLSFPPVVQNDRQPSQSDADNVYSDNRVRNPGNFQNDNSKLAENVSSCQQDRLAKVAVNSLPLEILITRYTEYQNLPNNGLTKAIQLDNLQISFFQIKLFCNFTTITAYSSKSWH